MGATVFVPSTRLAVGVGPASRSGARRVGGRGERWRREATGATCAEAAAFPPRRLPPTNCPHVAVSEEAHLPLAETTNGFNGGAPAGSILRLSMAVVRGEGAGHGRASSVGFR